MSIAPDVDRFERQRFGETLDPATRLVAALVAIAGVVGHAVFAAAVILFLYVLLFVA